QSDAVEGVTREIVAGGGSAHPLALDVTRAAERERLVTGALERFGRFDALVNNAAIQRIAMPLDVTEEHWDSVMNVNAKALYFCCQVALRHMLPQRSGRIVNIASMAGKAASTVQHPIYNVSKAAVIAITKTLAAACAQEGVRVNAVCPGMVETAMQEKVDAEFSRVTGKPAQQIRAERMARVPMGWIASPDEIADVVAFLIGPESRYMTGQSINVTGGAITY
ncbi:MAG TPA: SDR family NAD(P)-dependent oxidoreductase, partial [Roseiflexaceae bacterium]|nr:SDR family NAD(P)-dependent oxidoreductase [Roseiflexaceae bacterium]